MKKLARNLSAAAGAFALPFAFASPALAAQSATVQLTELNDSGASGTATLLFDDSSNALTVSINATGLVPNLPHAQHIHIGGRNVCPGPETSTGDDNILSTPEGQPAYGEIQVSLTTTGDFGPGSALAVDRMPVADASGTIEYERTFDLTETMGDITLDDVVIVQHGIDTISPNGQYGPPPPNSPLDPSLPLEATAPADCGAVTAVADTQTPQTGETPTGGVAAGAGDTAGLENEGLLVLGALGLLGAYALTFRHAVARSK